MSMAPVGTLPIDFPPLSPESTGSLWVGGYSGDAADGAVTWTGCILSLLPRWCGPCKILGPRLEKMVAKQRGKVVMAKVDIDDHTDLAIEYEVWIGRGVTKQRMSGRSLGAGGIKDLMGMIISKMSFKSFV